jgi:hypothetical protein
MQPTAEIIPVSQSKLPRLITYRSSLHFPSSLRVLWRRMIRLPTWDIAISLPTENRRCRWQIGYFDQPNWLPNYPQGHRRKLFTSNDYSVSL